MGAIIGLFLINVCEARADLPPETWHCASQEQCFALLVDDGVLIVREGVGKGLIQNTGVGDGHISVDQGIVMVSRSGGNLAYLHNMETGITCEADLTEECYPGIIAEHNGADYAVFVCPTSALELARWISLDCLNQFYISMGGGSPVGIAKGDTYNYIEYGDTSDIGVMLGTGMGPSPTGLDTSKEMVYNQAQDLVYINGIKSSTNGIYTKPMPPDNTFVTLWRTLPSESNYLSGSADYLAVSSNTQGHIIDFTNPSGMVSITMTEPRETAVSPVTASEPVQVYFIEGTSPCRIRAFDETGTELGFSPIAQPAWDLAYVAPTLPPSCGNSLVEPEEVCDATDFDGLDCTDYGFDGGSLSCSASCDQIFTSGCWSCGDGVLNPGESCDGTAMGTETCQDEGYAAGELSCNPDCTYNLDMCYTCGNGLIEGPEQCEGADLNGADCTTEGFVSGTLTCDASCIYDISECSACGDNIANYGETCDGTDTPDMICQTLGLGYTGGELACNTTCDGYDDTGCYTCSDGTINLNEECDGTNLGTLTCADLGYGSGGTLSCFENCTFNVTQCDSPPVELCGNGVPDPGEECDDGNRSNNDDCSEFCKIIPPTCGIGGVDAGETCDGTDLNGETCITLGYEAGVLYCGDDCQLRTDGCYFINAPQTISLTLDAEPEPGELEESLQSQYKDLKSTLTPRCISQEVNGDLVFTTTEGSYCAIRAVDHGSSETKKMFSFIFLPENPLEEEQPVLRFYQAGGIAQNFGGHITAYKGLQVKTVLVQDRLYQVTQERLASMGMKFLSAHPETNISGRWLAVNIGTGSTSMCTDENGENCAKLIPEQGQVVINLDVLDDLSEIDWTPPPKSGGCSCRTASSNSNSLPVFLLLGVALLIARRRRYRSK